MSSKQRRKEIERIREKGRAARHAGLNRQNCPRQYLGTMDHFQWLTGWDQAEPARDSAGNDMIDATGRTAEEKVKEVMILTVELIANGMEDEVIAAQQEWLREEFESAEVNILKHFVDGREIAALNLNNLLLKLEALKHRTLQ